ncbi:MAG: metalloregulator ArsR/SmtB family transcription factor [Oscillospiraceae bacterium]|nr:metalloregulator ArsR/SmtB family transcription factor [Oscillospiraceae bacterium]
MDEYKKYEKKAEVLKALAHPIRLCIAKGLIENKCNVNNMQECLGAGQSNISQHLSKLKAARIVKSKKIGAEVYYYIDDDEIINLIKTI